jgi:hypothetical protein
MFLFSGNTNFALFLYHIKKIYGFIQNKHLLIFKTFFEELLDEAIMQWLMD